MVNIRIVVKKKNLETHLEIDLYVKWSMGDNTQKKCVDELGVSRATLHRKFKMI